MKRLLLVAVLVCSVSAARGYELVYPQEGGISILDEVRMGMVIEIDGGKLHSDIGVPLVRFQGYDWMNISLTLSLLDPQNIRLGEDRWYDDLNASLAVEADIVKLLGKVPVAGEVLRILGRWTNIGAGQILSFDDELANDWIAKVSAKLEFP